MNKWRSSAEKYEINPNKPMCTKTLEVENIDEDTSPKDLKSLFSKCGVVLSVAVEAGYESEYLADRDADPDDEELEPKKSVGPDKVVGRVTMLANDATKADRKLHGRKWRGQELRLTVQRNPWDSMPNFEE
jgi:hypothetical protein